MCDPALCDPVGSAKGRHCLAAAASVTISCRFGDDISLRMSAKTSVKPEDREKIAVNRATDECWGEQ